MQCFSAKGAAALQVVWGVGTFSRHQGALGVCVTAELLPSCSEDVCSGAFTYTSQALRGVAGITGMLLPLLND